ncbi:MAG: ATP-binding protein [Waterburya sp.]
MNHVNPTLGKTEIIKQLGYFPAFLIPAINSSPIYRSLVQQTLFAYINNPLPAKFKEKLFVILSRYFGISYFTICHSCTLRSLGTTAAEIIKLGNIKYPQSEAEVTADIKTLSSHQCLQGQDRQDNPQIEASLLRCAALIFLQPEQMASLSAELKKLLGTIYYHYLIVFLGYIKLCHQWLLSNPDISYQQDRRSQLYLGSLLLEEIKLAHFLTAKAKSIGQPEAVIPLAERGHNDSSRLTTDQDRLLNQDSLPQLRQKALTTTCLTNAPFPIMIHNQSGQIVYLNRNWLDATGYDAPEISTISKWNQKARVKQREIVKLTAKTSEQVLQKYVAPAHQTTIETTSALRQIVDSLIDIAPETTKTKIKAKNQSANAIRSEVTISTRSGEQLFWELYSATLSFDQSEDQLTISIAKDITDVIHHETKLAEVEAKLRLVLEATKTGNWSWNLITNQVDVCHRGRNILGLDDFDGSYASFLQSIYPREKESVDLEVARAIQAHQDLDLKYSIVNSNQEISQIRAKAKLNYNVAGQPISLTGIVTDITPAPHNQQQLTNVDPLHSYSSWETKSRADPQISSENILSWESRNTVQSLEKLETIINLLPYYLFVVDIQTETISLINSRLAQSLDLLDSAAIGRTIPECFAPEYVSQIAWQHEQVITYKQVLHIQEEVTLPDGIHHFDTVITPLCNPQGEISALLRTSSDIPDLAATQEALSQRTLQLEAANRELESFSYSVSHDLQAPLRVINGFSQVLWENYQPNLDDRGRHYLQRIQANSKRMSDLIDALLQLSRVTRSQMKLVKVNLSAIALEIIEELQAEEPQRQVKFKVAPDLETKGDPQLLRIVLSNLIHNAWKYTSNRSHSQIEFGLITQNISQPTFFIRDNGAGFDSEYADKLFTAFQRLHSQDEFPGTGIGLATVQRIIYRHGGKVWAEGECERGASIYFAI